MRKLYAHRPEQFEALRTRIESGPCESWADVSAKWGAPEFESRVVETLHRDGIAELPVRLDPVLCTELAQAVAESTKRLTKESRPGGRADVHEQVIVEWPSAQALMANDSFYRIAFEYLGKAPVLDLVAAWSTIPTSCGPSSEAAQMYHYDLDRVRFLKFFVYLTDVTDRHGPHAFVSGSHERPSGILRKDRRFTDAEVAECFGPEQMKRMIGPRGTVFAANTVGLHKGIPPIDGERIVFQLEYSTSLFGGPFLALKPTHISRELAAAARDRPGTFARFSLGPDGTP